jgi:cytochrome c biogenesis protein CcmG, thiol:disulfide interchange protein DsbE
VRRTLICIWVLLLATACASPSTPDPAPAGLEEKLEELIGKPVVVNYWATWCDPCREEMPFIVDAAKDLEGEVAFLGVNVQDNAVEAERFVREYGMPFESVPDPDREIANDQKLLGLPATQFFDADGELAFIKQGPIDEDELLEKIEDVVRAGR